MEIDEINQRIKRGDTIGAQQNLIKLLQKDNRNIDAWMLLGRISEDVPKKIECFRHVIGLDPENDFAKYQLQQLIGQTSNRRRTQNRETNTDRILCCPQCGGAMEVQFFGILKDKRAVCTYCGTEMDIPDTYQRVKKKRTREWNFNGSKMVEDTVIETRQDNANKSRGSKPLPPDIQAILQNISADGIDSIDQEILNKLKHHGIQLTIRQDAVTPEILQALDAKNIDIPIEEDPRPKNTIFIHRETHQPGLLSQIQSQNFKGAGKNPLLSKKETIKFFGIAPAPEDTRICPNPVCGATIPRNAMKCSWCGTKI